MEPAALSLMIAYSPKNILAAAFNIRITAINLKMPANNLLFFFVLSFSAISGITALITFSS